MDASNWWNWSIAFGAAGVTVLLIKRALTPGIVCKSKARMDGKTVVITGANCGIGKATAIELAKRGARLILACRDISKGEGAAKDIQRYVPDAEVVVKHLDLASLESVNQLASTLNKEEPKIDVLINNAGLYQCPFMKTEDGFEMQMGVNHLGHFYLTNQLMDKLKASAPSRVVVVSSALHKRGKIDFDSIMVPNEAEYDKKKGYSDSKLANCMFARELSKKADSSQVCVHCVHPGMIRTNLARHVAAEISILLKVLLYPLYLLLTKSPYYGCQTVVYCAVEESLTGVTGGYYGKCKDEPWTDAAKNDADAARLWELSSSLTGINK